jgi:NAD(P)-dependent dehydrogenase (short-subunit alcohol dehydrogenase family)
MGMIERVWFITGASRGFGRAFTEAALERGDRVAATARQPQVLDDLVERYGGRVLPLALDVTDRAATFAAVEQVQGAFGRIDVVVNNAGRGLLGAVEEAAEQDARDQFETNFFGALWVVQAVLPVLRAQGSGHILQMTSLGGVVAFPGVGVYNASKWALEALSESLAREVASFGIKVTCVEPGGFRTDWWGTSLARATQMPEYDDILAVQRKSFTSEGGASQPGDPALAAQAVLAIVDSPEPPLRVLLGGRAVSTAKKAYQSRLAEWSAWEDLAASADTPR